ncbi:MAG: hypothetical protein ACRDTV_16520 [Mycobacterium sp.]
MAVTSCSGRWSVKPAASATQSASAAAVTGSFTVGLGRPWSPGPVPAGYRRVVGTTQGISVAAPASWVAIDLANESIQRAAKKLHLHGISASTIVQDMESAQKLHAVLVVDLKAAVDSPQHFTPDLGAFCSASGVTDAGAAGVPILKTSNAAAFAKLGATHITQQDLEIGGVPGVETRRRPTSSAPRAAGRFTNRSVRCCPSRARYVT